MSVSTAMQINLLKEGVKIFSNFGIQWRCLPPALQLLVSVVFSSFSDAFKAFPSGQNFSKKKHKTNHSCQGGIQ